MSAKFRILLRPIETSDEVADRIIKAIVVLHNFLLTEASQQYDPAALADVGDENNGRWRQEVALPLQQVSRGRGGANKSSQEAKKMRSDLQEYFGAEGAVDWQDDYM
jgi:hypothetical protein